MKNKLVQLITQNFIGIVIFTIVMGILTSFINENLKLGSKSGEGRKENPDINIENKNSNGNTTIIGSNIHFTPNTSKKSHNNFNEILKTLDDIERILPTNIPLQNCIRTEKQKNNPKNKSRVEKYIDFNDLYAYCKSTSDYDFLTVSGIMMRDKKIIETFTNLYPNSQEYFDNISFFSYEIENNLMTRELWLYGNCSEKIKVIRKGWNLNKILASKAKQGFMPCLIISQDLGQYRNRVWDKYNINFADSREIMSEKQVPMSEVQTPFIGNPIVDDGFSVSNSEILERTTITNLMMEKNQLLHQWILENIFEIKKIFQAAPNNSNTKK